MYLLDTNVISELRKKKPHLGVLSWIRDIPEGSLFLSAMSVGAIQAGIEITRGEDELKAAELEGWLEDVASTYNVLPADAAVFRQWAKLMHRKTDHHLEDALIAATARVRGLTVATSNVDDFHGFGVKLLNPFRP